MKSLSDNFSRKAQVGTIGVRAFTLVELMVTMAIFLLLVMAMVAVQVFGFKINSLTTSKLKFTASSLKALDQIQGQVRGASSVVAGNGSSLASFSSTGTSGNALKIQPPTGGANLLYLATNTGTLYEIYSANNKKITVGSGITNRVVFQTVDYNGNNVSSTSLEHYAIRMTLKFSQVNYRVPVAVSDCYTFQTEMTPRTQN